MKRLIISAACALAVSQMPMTDLEAAGAAGPYVGAGGGVSMFANTNPDENDLQTELTNAGITGTVDLDTTDVAFKIYGGYTWISPLGPVDRQSVEISYMHLGSIEGTANITAPAAVTINLEEEVQGVGLDWVGHFDLTPDFSGLVKAGVFYWSADYDLSVTSGAATYNRNGDDTGLSPMVGLGAEYKLGSNFMLRGEWEYIHDAGDKTSTGEASPNVFTLSGVMRF